MSDDFNPNSETEQQYSERMRRESFVDWVERWDDLAEDFESCPHCDGTGWQDCGVVSIECPECGGGG